MSRFIAVIKAVWRWALRSGKTLGDVRDRSLLRLRISFRRLRPHLSNVFDRISPTDVPVFVINLKKRPDRLQDVSADLKRVGFTDVRVIEAIDGPAHYPSLLRGHAANLGCTQSHLKAIEDNLRAGRPVAVCEDDNEFVGSPEEIQALIADFLRAPEYDVLCLSARVRGPKVSVSPEFNLVSWALAPAFYIAKPRAREPLLSAYRKSIHRLRAQRRRGPFDQVWSSIQRYRLLFVTPVQRLARQKESHSDIQGKFFAGT